MARSIFLLIAMFASSFFSSEGRAQKLPRVVSIAEPLVKWSKKQIRVCWRAPTEPWNALTEEEKRAVQERIQAEFTPDRTGIHFVGFQPCPATIPSSIDVVLSQRTDLDPIYPTVMGLACIGEGGELTNAGYTRKGRILKPYIYLRGFRKNPRILPHAMETLVMTAVHEFGHLSGLRHEHARPEAKRDPNCMQYRETLRPEWENKSTRRFTNYDPRSIMNYCWEWTVMRLGFPNGAPGLSPGDVYTLKMMYP